MYSDVTNIIACTPMAPCHLSPLLLLFYHSFCGSSNAFYLQQICKFFLTLILITLLNIAIMKYYKIQIQDVNTIT